MPVEYEGTVAEPQSGPQVAPVVFVQVDTFEIVIAGQAGGAGVSAKQVLTKVGGYDAGTGVGAVPGAGASDRVLQVQGFCARGWVVSALTPQFLVQGETAVAGSQVALSAGGGDGQTTRPPLEPP